MLNTNGVVIILLAGSRRFKFSESRFFLLVRGTVADHVHTPCWSIQLVWSESFIAFISPQWFQAELPNCTANETRLGAFQGRKCYSISLVWRNILCSFSSSVVSSLKSFVVELGNYGKYSLIKFSASIKWVLLYAGRIEFSDSTAILAFFDPSSRETVYRCCLMCGVEELSFSF